MTTLSTPKGDTPAGTRRTQPVVACQRLTKHFKDFWLRDRARAVDGVTFEVQPREVFGLLGPNGSGKSTTIKVILGLLRPSGGRVVVFGKAPTDIEIKRRIGYLPEESYLYPFLNARETLDYYARLFQIDRKTRVKRIDELLEMVGLSHVQHRAVREYSKGMQRRIGLAQALINDPDLLILDEPTTGLDPIGTRQVKDLIIELGRRGKTIILSSHLLADVEDTVDRMVILYGGKIRDEGPTAKLLVKGNRTSITADELDDATIAEIDAIIRKRSGGEKSILNVSHPRQKLEEIFLDIVRRAQDERLSTSGAQHGGETASFLRGEAGEGAEQPGGEALIASLTREEEPQPEPIADDVDEGDRVPTAEERRDAVLGSLVADDTPPEASPGAPAGDAPGDEPPEGSEGGGKGGPDRGVLDDLLGDDKR